MDNSFLHRKRLLLVDDAPGLLNMVAGILHDAGFEAVLFQLFEVGLEPGRKHDEYDAQLRQYVERGAAADGDEFSAGQRFPHGGTQEKTRHQRADDLRQAYAAEQQPQQLGAEQYE